MFRCQYSSLQPIAPIQQHGGDVSYDDDPICYHKRRQHLHPNKNKVQNHGIMRLASPRSTKHLPSSWLSQRVSDHRRALVSGYLGKRGH
jgi:hypothetical protein